MEVIKIDSECTFKNNKLRQVAFEKFSHMRKSQELCDITILGNNDVPVHCHRLVLSGCSSYFQAMFKNYKEKNQTDIKLEWITSEILSLIINYIYTCEIIISQETVQDLLAASDMFELLDLRNACVDFIEQQLNVNNCLGIEAIADLYNCSELLSNAQRFIEYNFREIVGTEEFLILPMDRLIKLLANDNLNVSEGVVFESVLTWLKHDLENREKYFFDLIKNVRVKLLTSKFLVQKFSHNSFLRRQLHLNSCLFLNLFQLKYDELNENDNVYFSTNSLPRKCTDLLQVLIVIGGYNKSKVYSVEFYDFEKQKWHAASDIHEFRNNVSATVLNEKLYVAGGVNKTVEIYDSLSNTWSYLPPMLNVRRGLGFAGINSKLIAVGGYGAENTPLYTCEQFDFETQEWSPLPSMLWKAAQVGSQIIDNILYIIGGSNERGDLNSVQAFNFQTQKWLQLPDMSFKRRYSATCVLNGMLYVCGGESASAYLNQVECYDPQTNSWTLVECMNTSRAGASASAYKGLIYVVGGFNGIPLSSIEVYDPKQNVWSVLPISLTSSRYNHAAVLMRKLNLKSFYTP